MRLRGTLLIFAAASIVLAAWPAFINNRIDAVGAASLATPAPVMRDYEQRDALVTFLEGAVHERHRNDMLSPRQLAAQYLQRYRERGHRRRHPGTPHGRTVTGSLAAHHRHDSARWPGCC